MNPREISTTSTPGCLPQPEGRADPLGQIVHHGDLMSAVQYLLNADTPDANPADQYFPGPPIPGTPARSNAFARHGCFVKKGPRQDGPALAAVAEDVEEKMKATMRDAA